MGNCASAAQKSINTAVKGHGGELIRKGGRKVVLITAFNYSPKDYGGQECWGGLLCELSSVKDGQHFAALATASGAEVIQMYDSNVPGNNGFPNKDVVKQKLMQLGSELGDDDCFVWFYGGHGKQCDDSAEIHDGTENDTELCFCDQQGQYTPFKDNEIADILLHYFNDETDILVVTDCCQSGTVCDLSNPEYGARPVCHMAAVKDSQYAIDWGEGGGFTTCMVEAIEDLREEGGTDEFSIVELYNRSMVKFHEACEKYGDDPAEQTFAFERSPDSDPDEFMWPLVPPEGWEINTMLDRGIIVQ